MQVQDGTNHPLIELKLIVLPENKRNPPEGRKPIIELRGG